MRGTRRQELSGASLLFQRGEERWDIGESGQQLFWNRVEMFSRTAVVAERECGEAEVIANEGLVFLIRDVREARRERSHGLRVLS